MNRFRNLIGVFAFALLILTLPVAASAQYRNDRNDDDDYYRNDRRDNRRNDDYNRNGNYNRNLQATIKNLKNRSKQFERQVDRALDRSRYDDRNREDRINQLAGDFADAAKRLDDEYDNRRDYNNSYDEAQRVLQLGNQLDRAISRARLNGNVQNDWYRIRQDLNVLANAYNYDNRNNRNNRNRQGNNGDWRSRIPFPLPF
jgi:predicted RNase H-like nuclease (RuvC/YqgF family)